MRGYFSKSMLQQEFKKVKWFSPVLFLILFLVFNNHEMLSVAVKGSKVGFSDTYAIKNFISLSWIDIIILTIVYTISCTILMSNKAKYLQSEKFQGNKRVSYFITEGIFLASALGIGFMANYLLKVIAYIANRKAFYNMGSISLSCFVRFLIFHLIFIVLMVSINLLLHSMLGKPYSVIMMPILMIYSYLLIFGTGYFLLSENHTKAREFIKWVDNSTVSKLYEMINGDYRLALQDKALQASVMAMMLISALILLALGFLSYRYMKPERLNRYFMYSGVEIVVMGFIFTACALYLGILTSVIMLVRNEKLDMIKAWDYAYTFMFIYIALAAIVRITYVLIKKKPWELYTKKQEKGNMDIQA